MNEASRRTNFRKFCSTPKPSWLPHILHSCHFAKNMNGSWEMMVPSKIIQKAMYENPISFNYLLDYPSNFITHYCYVELFWWCVCVAFSGVTEFLNILRVPTFLRLTASHVSIESLLWSAYVWCTYNYVWRRRMWLWLAVHVVVNSKAEAEGV